MNYKCHKQLSKMYYKNIEDIKKSERLEELVQRRAMILNDILNKLPEHKRNEFRAEIEKYQQHYYDSLYFYAMYLKGFADSKELKKALKL